MKHTRLFPVILLITILLLTACSSAGTASIVDRLTALANTAQAASASDPSSSAAPVIPAAAQQPTDAAAAEIPVTDAGALAEESTPVQANTLLAAFEGTLAQVYEQVNPSVVNIQVESTASGASFGRGFGQGQGIQQSLGSGFVWDTEGHIVTNYHVVEGASRVTVTFADGTTYSAEPVGADPNADLAVIKIDAPADVLHPVTLADSTKIRVGELAIAIGNPYGLSGTMTYGIISALSRSLPVEQQNAFGEQTGAVYTIPDIIQTDAAINPGNSGGVLVDENGHVIGVTTAIQSTTQSNSGIGFVVPSAIVQRVVPSIVSTGTYEHPYMGISGLTLTSDLAAAMNLSESQRGVLVIDVSSGTPAERAGLRGSSTQVNVSGQAVPVGGDVITAIDGQAVTKMEDLTSYLMNSTQVGQAVTLTLLRQGQEQAVEVTLGALPASSGQ